MTESASSEDLRHVARGERTRHSYIPGGLPERLEVAADALDALRESYIGCDEGSRMHGIRCGGTYPNGSHEFCAEHETMFWDTIARLLGTTDNQVKP